MKYDKVQDSKTKSILSTENIYFLLRINMKNPFIKFPIHNQLELVDILSEAANRQIIAAENIPIIEGILNIAHLKASDIMIPRISMDIIDVNDTRENIVKKITETGHSRFPVIDGEISNIVGILHSKDLIAYIAKIDEFNVKSVLRQAYFVPEIKHLDGLMYEMRLHQNHMALVVDEFTNIVGLVTLEMIVEQIIGEIEDEHDSIDDEREIIMLGINQYRIKGRCKLNQFNQVLHLNWNDNFVETVNGFLIKFLGRIPVKGEILDFETISIEIINSDSRKINSLLITVK